MGWEEVGKWVVKIVVKVREEKSLRKNLAKPFNVHKRHKKDGRKMWRGGNKSLPFLCHAPARLIAFLHVKPGVSGEDKGHKPVSPAFRRGSQSGCM